MRRNYGFTLIELTITIVLVAILAAAIVSAFSTGLQVWKRAQRQTDENQELSGIIETLSRDLRSATNYAPSSEDPPFTLDEFSSLSFIALIAPKGTSSIPYMARIVYRFDSEAGTLWRSTETLYAKQPVTDLEMETSDEEMVSDNIEHFAVNCWDGTSWHAMWPLPKTDAEEEKPELPQLVEISINLPSADSRPQHQRVFAWIPIEMARP